MTSNPLQSLYSDILLIEHPVPFFLGDSNGAIREVNAACREWYGDNLDWISEMWGELSKEAQNEHAFERDILIPQDQGEEVEVKVREIVSSDTGERLFPVFVFHAELLTNLHSHVRSQLLRDPLTGLPNRVLGQDRLQRFLERLSRKPGEAFFTLVYLDLDGFKDVNDFFGHSIGDALLKAVADRLLSLLRKSDTACRWGGDEFVLLLDDTPDVTYVQRAINRIMQGFTDPFYLQDHEIQIGVSLGVVYVVDSDVTGHELLNKADQAMYKAKGTAGVTSCHFIKHIYSSHWDDKNIVEEIRRGIDRNEFFLEYQPIIDLETETLSGVEAFIRWNHPDRGVLYPADFMHHVEKSNIGISLGEWIINEACQTHADWRERYLQNGGCDINLSMHINVSKSQLLADVFTDKLYNILHSQHISPNSIFFDCMKMSFLGDKKEAAQTFDYCNNLGVNLVLDDLKINLFNLNFFYKFHIIPFRMVKVNGHVVDAVAHNNTTIIESIRTFINILSGMGIKMAVKGIESSSQYQAVKNLKCHMGQGYYFSPPLSRDDIEKYLASLSSNKNNIHSIGSEYSAGGNIDHDTLG